MHTYSYFRYILPSFWVFLCLHFIRVFIILFACTESWTLVSDPTSRKFIPRLLFQTFIYINVWKISQRLNLRDVGSETRESVQPFNKRMNGHRGDLTKKTLFPLSQHFVLPWHSLDGLGRSKLYIIDQNPSRRENQRQKGESCWVRELQTLLPEGIKKGLNLLFFNFLTSAWSLASW